jgi:ATP-binding cassette, subfamily B (MDR/TAP), member 7
MQFRRDANKADNKAGSVAVDSLINFEAVKVRTFTISRIESK